MTNGTEHGEEERGDDVVAAEFVLGVLNAEEQAGAARRLDTDREFAMRVAAWEERFSGMNDAFGETRPPANVLARIEDRLFALDPTQKQTSTSLWTSLVFWRGLTIAAFAAIAVLAAALFMREAQRIDPGPELVASLSAADSDAAFVVLRRTDGTLHVTSVGAQPDEGRDHELWVIAGEDAPVSLGVVPADGPVATALPGRIAGLAPDQLTLAVSLEPAGGSPSGAPTGPIVAAGKLTNI